jgi:isochorismate hydrolase
MGPDINRSALVIVDMQNDFVHSEGNFGRCHYLRLCLNDGARRSGA